MTELKSPHSDYFIGKRFPRPKKASGSIILLPEDYMVGSSFGNIGLNHTYKLVRILQMPEGCNEPDLKPGAVVMIHELDQVDCGSEDPLIKKFPIEKVMAVYSGPTTEETEG